MKRLERFRQARLYRRKLVLTITLFFLLIAVGTCLADFSINSLMNGRNGLNMLSFNSRDSGFEFVLMNRKISIDTTYIKQDIERLKGWIEGLLGLK